MYANVYVYDTHKDLVKDWCPPLAWVPDPGTNIWSRKLSLHGCMCMYVCMHAWICMYANVYVYDTHHDLVKDWSLGTRPWYKDMAQKT
jgi:hypothetical protein